MSLFVTKLKYPITALKKGSWLFKSSQTSPKVLKLLHSNSRVLFSVAGDSGEKPPKSAASVRLAPFRRRRIWQLENWQYLFCSPESWSLICYVFQSYMKLDGVAQYIHILYIYFMSLLSLEMISTYIYVYIYTRPQLTLHEAAVAVAAELSARCSVSSSIGLHWDSLCTQWWCW